MKRKNNHLQHHPAPPQSAYRARPWLLTAAVFIWLFAIACPRPPASFPLESFALDARGGQRQDTPTDQLQPPDPPQVDTQKDANADSQRRDQVTDAPNGDTGKREGLQENNTNDTNDTKDSATPEDSREDQADQSTHPEVPTEPTPCPTPPTKEAVDLLQQWQPLGFANQPQAHTMPPCNAIGFRLVAPANMEIQVDVTGLPRQYAFALAAYNARRTNQVAPDAALASKNSATKNYISLNFKVTSSGEVGVVLYGWQHPTKVPFNIQAFCTKQCQLETTRFPIVLMHGFAGTDKYFGILEYFYKVKPHLESAGFQAFTPTVQPIANSTKRVLALKKQIDDIFTKTGARKLNLIAHSQGGVDGRLLISSHKYHDKIASLTTISTPHRGIPVPNLLLPPSQELGEANMKKYNAAYPDHPNVKYFSWAGVSCGILDRNCRKKYNNESVDLLLTGTYEALKALRGANDGIVPLSSAKWGTFLGEIPADHFDEIGQIADRNNKSFDHKAFYLDEAKRLKKLGF